MVDLSSPKTIVSIDDNVLSLDSVQGVMQALVTHCSPDGAIDVHDALFALLGATRIILNCVPQEQRAAEFKRWAGALERGMNHDLSGVTVRLEGGRA